jgi:putative restriction endonuclease
MAVRLIVAVTDENWFEHLRRKPDLNEVNFWAPSAPSFKALEPGELFLFKLHAPRNVIVGGGIFTFASAMPCSLAWEAFGEANGAANLTQMRARIAKYRKVDPADRSDFVIGCRILTQPFFWPEPFWIPVPESWHPNTVSFKVFPTDEPDGYRLWEAVQNSMQVNLSGGFAEEQARYGEPTLVRPRLGQGAFRILVTESYSRTCAISGEKTLPALDAAHIRPFAAGGTHDASNGVLMRRDIHSLFDSGYVTITPDLRFEVSPRIREEFSNGRHYYALHGQKITIPESLERRPNRLSLQWHNDEVFLS